MHKRYVIGTALALIFSTAAVAQSPSSSSQSTTQQPRANTTTQSGSTSSGSTAAPSTTQSAPAATAPSNRGSAQTSQPATGATTTQNQPPATSGTAQTPAASGTAQTPTTSGTAQTQPASPTTVQPAPSTQQPATNQAQTPQGSQPATNSAQSPAPAGSTSTNNAQAPSSNTTANVSASINVQQQTRMSQSIARLNVQPLSNVNFSVAVGTVIPRSTRLQTLPPDIVQIVPQYRGYNFVLVRDEIVIVEPSTYRIVSVLPRSGSRAATAPAASKTAATRSRVKFSDKERAVIRQHARPSREGVTTGSAARAQMRAGDRVPDTVQLREFPETIYREVPTVREYRYIEMDNRSYLIEPRQRTIIEEID